MRPITNLLLASTLAISTLIPNIVMADSKADRLSELSSHERMMKLHHKMPMMHKEGHTNDSNTMQHMQKPHHANPKMKDMTSMKMKGDAAQ